MDLEMPPHAGFSPMGVAQNSRARDTQAFVFGSTYQGAILVQLLSHSYICFSLLTLGSFSGPNHSLTNGHNTTRLVPSQFAKTWEYFQIASFHLLKPPGKKLNKNSSDRFPLEPREENTNKKNISANRRLFCSLVLSLTSFRSLASTLAVAPMAHGAKAMRTRPVACCQRSWHGMDALA